VTGAAEPVLDEETAAAFARGVAEFNAGKFFECHDTLEEVWRGTRGPGRDFFQGLIQISVGFYHLRNGNLRGGASQLERGLAHLAGYGPSYAGLRLAELRSDVEVWLARVRAGEPLRGTVADLPKYRLEPGHGDAQPPG
jgi:predicted metal-dependent hydrolase